MSTQSPSEALKSGLPVAVYTTVRSIVIDLYPNPFLIAHGIPPHPLDGEGEPKACPADSLKP
jgi:hypothetical protein